MIVQVYFDGGEDPTAHEFDAFPAVGDLLKWGDESFRVVERGFFDWKGSMKAAVWCNSLDPDEILEELPKHLRSTMTITSQTA